MITLSTTKKQDPIPALLKIREVVEVLNVSRQTVHNLIENGDLIGSEVNPSSKKRPHWRVTRESLLLFYEKRFGHSLNRALKFPFES